MAKNDCITLVYNLCHSAALNATLKYVLMTCKMCLQCAVYATDDKNIGLIIIHSGSDAIYQRYNC